MATNNSCDEPTAATGKILQGQGVGVASNFSTATYPSTATGTGKILRADGTNWVATTATYPDTAGTSGNVLTSDGTNWVSSAAASGTLYNGFLTSQSGNPIDSTTYYFRPQSGFTIVTDSSLQAVHFYIPIAITLNRVYGAVTVDGTLGSTENCTVFIRKNNSSNTNVTTTLKLNAAENTFNTTSLGLSLVAGDFISVGFTGPAWATNPTTCWMAIAWSN